MSDDKERTAATSSDWSHPIATSRDNEYSLSIEDALARYHAAGIPRTPRSVQRYCAKGDLKCHLVETSFGQKFLITPESLENHIAYIREVRRVAPSHDVSRPDATSVVVESIGNIVQSEPATSDDNKRPTAANNDVSRPAAASQKVIDMLERENSFLREQISVKDKQIADQSERVRETNILVGGLQKLLTPLLSVSDRRGDAHADG